MELNYSKYSNYAKTSINTKFLGLYRPPLNINNLSEETIKVEIESKYDRRPDLFAFDTFGSQHAWWVIAHYNRDLLKDPVMDFRAGIIVTIPKRYKVPGV
jgi:hypothetical protein